MTPWAPGSISRAHALAAGERGRDEDLADRVRELVGQEAGLTEKRMFGGLAMLVNGNMAVVIRGAGGLMVRVDPAESEQLQTAPGAQRP